MVSSPSKNVSALGFTVNGKDYGAAGTSYQKSGLANGTYTFGVRVNGVFGTDVGCTAKGKKTFALHKDTVAYLIYDGKHCTVQMKKG